MTPLWIEFFPCMVVLPKTDFLSRGTACAWGTLCADKFVLRM